MSLAILGSNALKAGILVYNASRVVSTYMKDKNPKAYKVLEKVNNYILSLDIGSFAISHLAFMYAINDKFQIVNKVVVFCDYDFKTVSDLVCLIGVTYMTGIAGLAMLGVYVVNRYIQKNKEAHGRAILENIIADVPEDQKEAKRENIIINFERPASEERLQVKFLSELVVSISLNIFIRFSYFGCINAILQGINLFNVTRRNWASLDFKFDRAHLQKWYPSISSIQEVIVSYKFFMIPVKNEQTEEVCLVCSDDESTERKYYVCEDTRHALHESCLFGTIYGKMQRETYTPTFDLDSYALLDTREEEEVVYQEEGTGHGQEKCYKKLNYEEKQMQEIISGAQFLARCRHLGQPNERTVSYTVTIPEENLPTECSSRCTRFSGSSLAIKVIQTDGRTFYADVQTQRLGHEAFSEGSEDGPISSEEFVPVEEVEIERIREQTAVVNIILKSQSHETMTNEEKVELIMAELSVSIERATIMVAVVNGFILQLQMLDVAEEEIIRVLIARGSTKEEAIAAVERLTTLKTMVKDFKRQELDDQQIEQRLTAEEYTAEKYTSEEIKDAILIINKKRQEIDQLTIELTEIRRLSQGITEEDLIQILISSPHNLSRETALLAAKQALASIDELKALGFEEEIIINILMARGLTEEDARAEVAQLAAS